VSRRNVAPMRRRCIVLALSSVLLTGAVHAGAQSIAGSSQVRLAGWPWYGKNSPLSLAETQGDFDRRRIKFTLLETYQAPLTVLAVGNAEIAQVSTADALRAVERGAPIRIIAVRDAVLPVVTVALPRSGIRTPKDYAGKRWGVSEANWLEEALMPILASRAGFDAGSIRRVHVDTEVQLTTLMQQKIDFIAAGWGSSLPQMVLAERKVGVELSVIKWSQHGIDVYGDCLAARTAWLEEHPGVARDFLAAAISGFKNATAHPALAVGAVLALNPDLTQFRDVIRLQTGQSADLLYDAYSRAHGLFSIDRVKLLYTRNASLGAGSRIPIERTYSNDYLPAR